MCVVVVAFLLKCIVVPWSLFTESKGGGESSIELKTTETKT